MDHRWASTSLRPLLVHYIGRPCRTYISNPTEWSVIQKGGSHLGAMPLKVNEAMSQPNARHPHIRARFLCSLRILTHLPDGSLSRYPTRLAPPPPFPERSQIADCRTCVRQSRFTSSVRFLGFALCTQEAWNEHPSVLPAQSHARASSTLVPIFAGTRS